MYAKTLAGLAALILPSCATPSTSREWTMQASATAGAALIYHDGQADEVRIACRRNPADLYVRPTGFVAAAGNESLLLRSGDTVLTLRVTAIPGMSKAIEATGSLTRALNDLLDTGLPMRLEYAGQSRALPAVEEGLREDFARACSR